MARILTLNESVVPPVVLEEGVLIPNELKIGEYDVLFDKPDDFNMAF
jgi:hypothetical protein